MPLTTETSCCYSTMDLPNRSESPHEQSPMQTASVVFHGMGMGGGDRKHLVVLTGESSTLYSGHTTLYSDH